MDELFQKLSNVFSMQGKYYAARFPQPPVIERKNNESFQPFTQIRTES